MLSIILQFLTSSVLPVLKNPKALISIAAVALGVFLFVKGCNYGQSKDKAEIASLKAKIDSIEHAPVQRWTTIDTIKPQPPETKKQTIPGAPDQTAAWKARLDSLRKVFGDSLANAWALIDFLATPIDSVTSPDTLRVDTTFVMSYQIALGAYPLDRSLWAQLRVTDIALKLTRSFEKITMPPEPAWYDYTPIGWLIRLLKWIAGL